MPESFWYVLLGVLAVTFAYTLLLIGVALWIFFKWPRK